MIRAIILDDGSRSKNVVVNFGINFKKIRLASFLNSLCLRHYSECKVKTAHYEDLDSDSDAAIFISMNDCFCDNANIAADFEKLWESEDLVIGIDLY